LSQSGHLSLEEYRDKIAKIEVEENKAEAVLRKKQALG